MVMVPGMVLEIRHGQIKLISISFILVLGLFVGSSYAQFGKMDWIAIKQSEETHIIVYLS